MQIIKLKLTIKGISKRCKVPESTLYVWRNTKPDLFRMLEKATLLEQLQEEVK